MNNTNETCPICGGKKTKGKTTFSADLDSGAVVVREVDYRQAQLVKRERNAAGKSGAL